MNARQELEYAAVKFRAWDAIVFHDGGNAKPRLEAYEAWLTAVRRFWLAQRAGTVDL